LRIQSGVETMAALAVTADSLHLEDFSEPWPRTRLSTLTGFGSWYDIIDTVAPALQHSRLERAVVDDNGNPDGPALRTRVVLDSAYAGVGLHLGRKEGTYDFSTLRVLRFMARGRGKVRVTVESPLLDTPLDEQFEYVVEMPPEWTAISIPVDSLRLPPGSEPALRGVTWNQVSSGIIRIEFMVKREYTTPGDSVEFWLDDLALDGVPFRAFIP
jgi:hypothetical protein